MGVNSVVVDTSAYSAGMRGHPRITSRLRGAEILLVSPIVLGELHAGFRKGRLRAENEAGLTRFLSSARVRVAPVDEETAVRYAEIVDYLRGIGRPAPTNDVWIAATAMQHGAAVLTTDSHFDAMPQILVEHWPVEA